MDARQIDAKRPDVTFDMHCAWMAGALGRQVSPPCDAWQALSTALEHAAIQQTERQLRGTLVSEYLRQSEAEIEKILEAKFEDHFSFFSRCGIADLQQARSFWDWYLLCVLDCESFGDEVDVRMPLDMVDMQILACVFGTQINILQLFEPAMKICPQTCETPATAKQRPCLLHHRDHWAAVLGSATPDMELQPLIGSVVEVGAMLPGILERAEGCTAVIKDHDEEAGCYLGCINQAVIPLARDQIRQIYVTLSDCDSIPADEGWISRLKNAWHGIAPQSIEWAVLHELVRQESSRRLELMQQDLAGRTELNAPNSGTSADTPNNAAPTRSQRQPRQPRQNSLNFQQHIQQQLQHRCIDRGAPKKWRWTDVVSHIESTPKVVIIPRVPSFVDFPGELSIEKEDEVTIKRISGEPNVCWVLGAKDGVEGWISSDNLLIWNVVQRFEEPAGFQGGTAFLPLEANHNVIVKDRFSGDWAGWALGQEWKEDLGSDGQTREGVFPLQYVVPYVLSKAEQC